LQSLLARGHEVALLAHAESTATASARFSWAHVQARGPVQQAQQVLAVHRALRSFRPELVHCFARMAYLAPWLATSLPKLVSFQRDPTPYTVRWAARLGGSSLRFSGCSEYIAGLGRAAGGHWQSIANFVDPARIPFAASVADPAPLLFLSRLEAIKGAHLAIRVAKATGIPLILAGNRIEQGEGRRYFDEQIAPHLDGSFIHWVGPVDDQSKFRLLGKARAMLVPIQWNEPFGIVFAEALACGTPVISAPRGALPEIVVHGEHGFLGDCESEWISAVRAAHQIDRGACRLRAEQCFSRERIVDAYAAVYAQMLQRSR
jgi:glycosyltransferase involved in cell wall biosynthesis